MIKSYLKYRKNSVNAHGIHSPFVFEFYEDVIKEASKIDDSKIRILRKELLNDDSEIEFLELGAGSRKGNKPKRKIAEIAKTSGITRKYGKLLRRIIDFYQIETCLELGTSLGIGTGYMASSPFVKKIITIEGCPAVAEKAKINFEKLKFQTIELIEGDFNKELANVIKKNKNLDLIFIDGNHTYKATINYFNQIIDKVKNDSILIFDDIHWSNGMERAWNEIIGSSKVNVTIDLFRMGIAIKRKDQAKEHFILKY